MFYVYADGESIFDPLIDTLAIMGSKVTLELGKSGSFQFSIPQNNEYYNKLVQLQTRITVDLDNTEIFRGRILSISRGFNNIKTVYCEGILSYLVDSVQKARRYHGKAKGLYTKIIEYHNQMVEADKQFYIGSTDVFDIENPEVVIPGKKEEEDSYYDNKKYEQAIIESIVDEWQTSFDYINTMFIDYLGGHLIARYNESNGRNYLDYISNETYDAAIEAAENNDSADHNVDIEFGVNMLDFSEEANAEDLFTVLIPLGEGEEENLTIAGASAAIDSSMEFVNINGKRIGLAIRSLRAKYGTIVKTNVFDNVNNANTLLRNAVKYLKRHKDFPITYTVKAIDLHYVNGTSKQIRLGDTVKIVSAQHKINRYLLCTKIEYDLANPANTFYTFGKPEQSLTERYKKNKDKEKKDSERGDKSGAKGGGKAAGAAGDAAEEKTNQLLDEFYDAYVKVDKEHGKISLATVYENTLKKLKSMSGIDLSSGPEGSSVNIYTMHENINKAMTSINQLSDDLHAEIESLAQYKTDTSESLARIKQYADEQQSYIEEVAEHESETGSSLSSFILKATDSFASVDSLAQFKTEFTDSIAAIRQWASEEFASITLEAAFEEKADENNREASKHRAAIEMLANNNKAEINAHTSSISENARSISNLVIRSNKLESIINATTSYDNRQFDENGNPIGSSANASLKITSDAIKAAINSDTSFATYIDGKLKSANTNIYQFANKNQAKIGLIADFDEKSSGITITSYKFMDELKSEIKLYADEVVVAGVFTAKDAATFKRAVYFNEGVTFNSRVNFSGGSYINGTDGNTYFNNYVYCNGGFMVKNTNLVVQAGKEIRIGTDRVMLFKEFTKEGIEKKLAAGSGTMKAYLRNAIKDDTYTTFADYINSIIKVPTPSVFDNAVTFNSRVTFPGGSYMSNNGVLTLAKKPQFNAGLQVNNDNLIVQAGHEIKIGSFPVALAKDVVSKDSFTKEGIEKKLAGASDMAAYLRNAIKGTYTTFAEYIKSIISDTYIKSIIDKSYVETALKGSYTSLGESLLMKIGCTKDGKACALSAYIKRIAKHSHTVSIPGHNHGGVATGQGTTFRYNGESVTSSSWGKD